MSTSELPILDPQQVSPLEYRILVMVQKAKEVTKGGIILTSGSVEKTEFGEVVGTFIKAGSYAFCNDEGQPIEGAPEAGDRIVMAKYSGMAFRDEDGNMYRFANDKDVIAVYGGGDE